MAKWLRLWGKKRGSRLSGWWVVGSVSEAAFFGVLFLLGTVSLTIVVSGQVFWPESTMLRPGFGFWLMVAASISFIVIGLTAFILQVSQTLASPEMRSAIASRVRQENVRRTEIAESYKSRNYLPSLGVLTDSPGVKLAYRLPSQASENSPLILSALFTIAWDGMNAVLFVVTVQQFLRDGPNWFLTVLLLPFFLTSYWTTRWFFQLFRQHARLGRTAIEIDVLPLLPGQTYKLYLCQYGRAVFQKLSIWLVSFEETTYQQGTDIRTEQRETVRIPVEMLDISEGQILAAEREKPLEIDCTFSLPADIMHSFQSENSAINWQVLVEGKSSKWPEFCRRFPVAVYPPSAV